MYDFLHEIFKDKTGQPVFSPLNGWHILYLALLFGGIALVIFLFKDRDERTKTRIIDYSINISLFLYIIDFMLMPFARGSIDIDKFPFHICTLMSITCFLSRHTKFFARFKTSFTVLAIVGPLMYIAYPAGVADGEVSMLCYRISETLLYHGLMFAYGVYSLAFGDVKLKWKECYKEAIMLSLITVWASFGNKLYEGVEDGRTFNWFCVLADPFGALPADVALYVMPFAMIAAVFAVVVMIYVIYHLIQRLVKKSCKKII